MEASTADMFGQLLYGAELSYEELLERENIIKQELEDAITKCNGIHTLFEPLGDALYFQSVFPEFTAETSEYLCSKLKPFCRDSIGIRLVFMPKNLSVIYTYLISKGNCAESLIPLPQLKL